MSTIRIIQTNRPPATIVVKGVYREILTGVESETISQLQQQVSASIGHEQLDYLRDISGAVNKRMVEVKYDDDGNEVNNTYFFNGTKLIPLLTNNTL